MLNHLTFLCVQWWGALLLTGAIVAGLSLLAVAAVKKYRERREGINRFKELQKSQMRGRPESDDDEYDSDPEEVAKRNAKKWSQVYFSWLFL